MIVHAPLTIAHVSPNGFTTLNSSGVSSSIDRYPIRFASSANFSSGVLP
jgi:hypothetical protein